MLGNSNEMLFLCTWEIVEDKILVKMQTVRSGTTPLLDRCTCC
jgi:hypothetical protein